MSESSGNKLQARHWLALALILVYSIAVRLALIDRAFNRDPEGVSAYYGILARNYLRRPFAQTMGVPVQNLGRTNPIKFYSHHPPFVPMTIALSYAAFGSRADSIDIPPDWQTRFSTVLFTLACIVTIFVMVKNRAGPRAGLIAASIFAALPITNYFGGFPDVVGTQLIFFILLTLAAYERFWTKPGAKPLAAMMIAFGFAAFTDWVAFFLPPLIAIHFVATRPIKQWIWIVGFAIACAALFFLAYGHIWLVERDWLWIRDKVLRRTGSVTDQRKAFTWSEWCWVSLISTARLFTIPVLLLALGWIIAPTRRRWRDPRAAMLVSILLGWAALHVLIGRQGVYQHQWWWWPLAPAAAIASALVVDRFAPRRQAFDVAIVTLLIALAAWSMTTTWLALHKPPGMSDDPNSHSITDIGRAIRTSVPPDTAVMLAEKDETAGLWYYADRPIVVDIWTIDGFLNRHADPGMADLPFGFTEQWHQPPQRFIFPKIYLRFAEPLLTYLQSHYAAYDAPPDVKRKFYVFDLTKPLP